MRPISLSNLAESELTKQQAERILGGTGGDPDLDMCKSCFCLTGDPMSATGIIADAASKGGTVDQ